MLAEVTRCWCTDSRANGVEALFLRGAGRHRRGLAFGVGVRSVLFAAVVVVMAACASAPQNNAQPFHSADGRTLCVATDLPAPGFWEGTAKHPTGGFEYELAVDLAEQFSLSGVRVVSASRTQLNEGVPSGCDLTIAEVTITSERQQRMTFSTPYYTTSLGVLTRAGTSVPD